MTYIIPMPRPAGSEDAPVERPIRTIYLAGPVSNDDWRILLVPDFPKQATTGWDEWKWKNRVHVMLRWYVFVGPFAVPGLFDERTEREARLEGIDQADLVFGWFTPDSLDLTRREVTYAAEQGKCVAWASDPACGNRVIDTDWRFGTLSHRLNARSPRMALASILRATWDDLTRGRSFVYFARNPNNLQFKIGHSKNPKLRCRKLMNERGHPVSLLGVIPGTENLEKHLQRRFDSIRVEGEQEWFHSATKLEKFIKLETRWDGM